MNTTAAPRAVTIDANTGDNLIPLPAVADEFHRNRRTLARWIDDEALGFPRPVRINGRLYVSRRALEAWKRERLSAALNEKAA